MKKYWEDRGGSESLGGQGLDTELSIVRKRADKEVLGGQGQIRNIVRQRSIGGQGR